MNRNSMDFLATAKELAAIMANTEDIHEFNVIFGQVFAGMKTEDYLLELMTAAAEDAIGHSDLLNRISRQVDGSIIPKVFSELEICIRYGLRQGATAAPPRNELPETLTPGVTQWACSTHDIFEKSIGDLVSMARVIGCTTPDDLHYFWQRITRIAIVRVLLDWKFFQYLLQNDPCGFVDDALKAFTTNVNLDHVIRQSAMIKMLNIQPEQQRLSGEDIATGFQEGLNNLFGDDHEADTNHDC